MIAARFCAESNSAATTAGNSLLKQAEKNMSLLPADFRSVVVDTEFGSVSKVSDCVQP
jgi:hypothetical protein